MDPADQRFVIGIDLGTTNSAVSYVDLGEAPARAKGRDRRIRQFQIPQLTGPGEVTRFSVLPSFLYLPGAYDVAEEAVSLPWRRNPDDRRFVGRFAREHGAKVPNRLVSSAKSWLCHGRADRRARILPWGAEGEIQKVSPVTAAAAYLEHIKDAWNFTIGEDDDLRLEHQLVILTVPASFDEVARDLTLEAAKTAGLKNVTLLEEPLAAFYSWLIRHEKDWERFVSPGELILVCDVGGGTTDFTLITLRQVDGSPRFERIAVGDHLILGGDNIDLALARQLETSGGRTRISLSGDRWKTLCHLVREAKELLLEGRKPSHRISLMGEGGKLIAGSVSFDLKDEDVIRTVLEGFFPLVERGVPLQRTERKGISEFGLPYEQEPAITRHLGVFLDRHREDVARILAKGDAAPDLILFNGGSLKPAVIQERVRQAIRRWFEVENTDLPRVLDNPDLDLAVAQGAAYYGLVKIGEGVRVGSGSPRSYYLGVGRGEPAAAGNGKEAVCLVERGLEEGSRIELPDRRFEVLANQPVAFDIYSSSFRSGDRAGDLVTVDDTLTALPPMQTVIQYGKKGVKTGIPVNVEASYTEMGTLALWCRSLVSDHRWKLQFQLRDLPAAPEVAEEEVFDEAAVAAARARIREAFARTGGGEALEGLVKEIANEVERPRDKWPLGLIRALADELLELLPARNLAPDFESRWMNLTGFCLRPGFGDGYDPLRLKALWKLEKQGPVHANHPQVRSEWWIMWRRIAGGLTAGQQRQVFQNLTPVLFPKKGGGAKLPPQERLEIWMALANLELLSVKDKLRAGEQLLTELRPKKYKPQQFWSLSRLGARELLYGPVDRVVPPEAAAVWIETILAAEWRNPKPVAAALAQMARLTGDRARDLEPALRERVAAWLETLAAGDPFYRPFRKPLQEVVPLERQEESAIFGESIPSGLVLHG